MGPFYYNINEQIILLHTKKKLPVFASINSCSATRRNVEEASFSPSFIVSKAKMAGGATGEKTEKEKAGKNTGKELWVGPVPGREQCLPF